MSDVAVIGDADTVLAFRLGGVDGHVVTDARSARQAFQRACGSEQGSDAAAEVTKLLLVTQHVVELVGDLLEANRLDPSAPMVLEIPGFDEHGQQRPLQQLLARVLRTGR